MEYIDWRGAPMSKELMEKLGPSLAKNEFVKHNHIIMDDIELTGASAHVDIGSESVNVVGVAHGGLHFSLADTCATYSARADEREYVTQQSNFYFLKGIKEGRMIAKGKVIKRTKRFCLVDVDVIDQAGNLLSKGSFNLYCVSDKLSGSN